MSKIYDILSRSERANAALILSLTESPAAIPSGVRLSAGARQPEAREPERLPNAPVRVDERRAARGRAVALQTPPRAPVLPFQSGNSQVTDQYRILRTKLTQDERQPKLILVTSPAAGDGKSITAINLAAALSLESTSRVLLIDGDPRKSGVHTHLGLPAEPGLGEVLAGHCNVDDAVVNAGVLRNLYILTAGTQGLSCAELLAGSRWLELCSSVRKSFQYVVLDAPPVEAVPEYGLLQAVCDGIVLVVRPDHTKRPRLRQALEAIPEGKLLGVLLNCVPPSALRRYGVEDY